MPSVSDDQLRGLLDRYFEALGAGDATRLPLASDVGFTENAQRLEVGRGLWATATGAAATRPVTVADVDAGEVAGWGAVTEAGHDALVAVRLKAPEGTISEIETLVVRLTDLSTELRLLNVENLQRPYPGFLDPVPQPERSSAEVLRRAANGYLDGVSGDRADLIPVAEDCVRIENGVQTVRNPTGIGLPEGREPNAAMSLGVAEQVRQGYCRHIESARERRGYLTDLERGLVLVSFFFDHAGGTPNVGGRVPFRAPNSMPAFEAFKVVGGTIRHIEAVINIFPYGTRSGW